MIAPENNAANKKIENLFMVVNSVICHCIHHAVIKSFAKIICRPFKVIFMPLIKYFVLIYYFVLHSTVHKYIFASYFSESMYIKPEK